ncbi:hypothetical protein [Paenirhodobacter sp.]|uniref:hypothetical protein n=1 Tax=Paenirhodobacter sp. TaxID=1965326 RepID=UPI003B40AA91
MIRLTLLALLGALAGCGSDGDYPALVPVGTLLSDAPDAPAPTDELRARGDALEARAEALRRAQP